MKTLYILRHAKAISDSKGSADDHERSLSPRGVESCPFIAEYLLKTSSTVDQIICSTAVRTIQTLENVLHSLKKEIPTDYLPKLYLASPEDILSEIGNVEKSVESLMVVGHNPGLHQLCMMLGKEGDATQITQLALNFPPGALAIIRSPTNDWGNVGLHPGKLVDFFIPLTH